MEKNKSEEEKETVSTITDLECGSITMSYKIQNNVTLKTDYLLINSKICHLELNIRWTDTTSSYNPLLPREKGVCQAEAKMYFTDNYLYQHNFKVAVYLHFLSTGYITKLKKQNDKCFYKNFTFIGYYPVNYDSDKSDFKDNTSKNVSIEIYFEKVGCQTISNTMDRLLSENTYSDLKIVTKDKEFNVHKNIVAVSNEVLSQMIESDMSEKKTGIINFSNWDSTTVENLIDYIYTGKCNIEKDPHKLFKLAHFLQIVELQSLCKNCLKLNVNEENLIDTLKLIDYDLYDLKDLDIIVKNFIKKNESKLSHNIQFIDFLIGSFTLNNITFALQFASKFKIEKLLSEARRYFHNNRCQALDKTEIKRFLKWNPTIMYELYKFCAHQFNFC